MHVADMITEQTKVQGAGPVHAPMVTGRDRTRIRLGGDAQEASNVDEYIDTPSLQ